MNGGRPWLGFGRRNRGSRIESLGFGVLRIFVDGRVSSCLTPRLFVSMFVIFVQNLR